MRAKIFKISKLSSKEASLEDRVNFWLKSNEVEAVEAVTTNDLLIIFYKKFIPNFLGR